MTRVDWVILAAAWLSALAGRYSARTDRVTFVSAGIIVSTMFVFAAEALK